MNPRRLEKAFVNQHAPGPEQPRMTCKLTDPKTIFLTVPIVAPA
jgi:hypothetical protein